MNYILRVEKVFIGNGVNASQPVDKITAALDGIQGDCHFGFTKISGAREKRFYRPGTVIWNSRQWSGTSIEELAATADGMGLDKPIKAEWLGTNLLFSGYANFTQLPPMTRLVFPSGAVLLVYSENLPCIWPTQIMSSEGGIPHDVAKLFGKAALHKRGLVGWVERAGTISPGDETEVYLPMPPKE